MRGQAQAIAENLMEMMTLRTTVLSILIGEGGSGGALALGVADEVWILENAIYSVISPEGCASILWKDTAKVQDAAQALRLTAQDMKAFGVVERIIPENGADFTAVYENLQKAIAAKLASLSALPKETLLQNRYARFRKFGAPAKTL